jgi:hypothetical protein
MSGSPIFDLEQAPPEAKKNLLWRLIALSVGALLGVVLGTFSIFPTLNVLLLLPALYVAIAVHELGHLLAGRIVGMKPGGLVIGGFSIVKSGRHHSVRFDVRGIAGGGMAMFLTTKNSFTPKQFAWMVAGGPLASFALMAACGVISLLLSDYGGGWTNILFWMALLTLSSLIPASVGVNKSDGARLWELLRHSDRAQCWIALIAMNSEERRGVRPRDWDLELVEAVLATEPVAKQYPYTELLMFYRQLDQGNEATAVAHLENALSASAGAGKLVRYCCFIEAAAASASIRKHPGNARTWFERARKVRRPIRTDGFEAAIAICEERYEDALKHIEAARKFFKRRKMDSGLVRFAMDRLDKSEARCKSAVKPAIFVAGGLT